MVFDHRRRNAGIPGGSRHHLVAQILDNRFRATEEAKCSLGLQPFERLTQGVEHGLPPAPGCVRQDIPGEKRVECAPRSPTLDVSHLS